MALFCVVPSTVKSCSMSAGPQIKQFKQQNKKNQQIKNKVTFLMPYAPAEFDSFYILKRRLNYLNLCIHGVNAHFLKDKGAIFFEVHDSDYCQIF